MKLHAALPFHCPLTGHLCQRHFQRSHLSNHLCTIDEIRSVSSWDFFSANNFVDKNAQQWAAMVQNLMREHCPGNNRLAIDISDPVGIQMLLKQFNSATMHLH